MGRLLLISLVALAAAGCGGGDDRLTREEFVQQANDVCREFDRKIDELGAPQTIGEIEDFADESAEIARDGRDELADLAPPETLEDDYDRLVEMLDQAIADIERVGDAAADGDEAEVQRIVQEASERDADSDRLARELGLAGCAED